MAIILIFIVFSFLRVFGRFLLLLRLKITEGIAKGVAANLSLFYLIICCHDIMTPTIDGNLQD